MCMNVFKVVSFFLFLFKLVHCSGLVFLLMVFCCFCFFTPNLAAKDERRLPGTVLSPLYMSLVVWRWEWCWRVLLVGCDVIVVTSWSCLSVVFRLSVKRKEVHDIFQTFVHEVKTKRLKIMYYVFRTICWRLNRCLFWFFSCPSDLIPTTNVSSQFLQNFLYSLLFSCRWNRKCYA